MKKCIVSLLAVSMVMCAVAADSARQIVVIPSGVTAVTNAVFASMAVRSSPQATARLVSYVANSSSNLTATLVFTGATYTNSVGVITSVGAATGTASAVASTPIVGYGDSVVVSLGGSNTNASPAYLYLNFAGMQ